MTTSTPTVPAGAKQMASMVVPSKITGWQNLKTHVATRPTLSLVCVRAFSQFHSFLAEQNLTMQWALNLRTLAVVFSRFLEKRISLQTGPPTDSSRLGSSGPVSVPRDGPGDVWGAARCGSWPCELNRSVETTALLLGNWTSSSHKRGVCPFLLLLS